MASLKDLIVTGPARFLDKLYGNLEGNATTANQWSTARTFTIGSKGWKVSGDNDVTWTHAEIGAIVSNAWEVGTTAGPKIKTTVNGVTGDAVAIPVATASASGVVTNTAQTFAGNKMFNGDILLHMGDSDRSIVFSYSNSTTISPSASWRIAGLGAGTSDTNYFVIQSGTSSTSGSEIWNNVIRIGQNTFDIGLGGNVFPLANSSKSLGTSNYQWKDAWFSGTVTITNTEDAAGNSDNKPALIVGGLSTAAHLEMDSNELMAKANGTTTAQLWLNSDGGLVNIGSGGLQTNNSNILVYNSTGADAQVKVQNSNGNLSLLTSTNKGLYDNDKGEWVIYRTKGTSTTLIPNWSSTGASDRPIYMTSSGNPSATTYRMAATNATATSAHSITTDLPTGIWYVSGTSDILGQSDGVVIANQYNANWISEIYQDYRTGLLAVRGKNNGTWQNWRKIPDGTGTNASGDWDITSRGLKTQTTLTSSTIDSFLEAGVVKWATADSTAVGENDGVVMSFGWSSNFGAQMWLDDGSGEGGMKIRNRTSAAWNPWRQVLTEYNYNNYAPTKTGTGASGTWGINITGSAGSVAWGNVSGKPSTFTPSSHTHNYLTAGSEGATASVRTADHTTALVTGGWATTSAGYKHQYGTTLDISGYSTWYHRLAFNTTGHIEYWHGINTKTLTKVGYLYTTQNIVYSSQQPTSNLVHGMIWLYPA